MKSFYKLIFCFLATQSVNAQQGVIDTSFGNNGVVTVEVPQHLHGVSFVPFHIDIRKVLFSNLGIDVKIGTDLATGSAVGGNVWNKQTTVMDAIESSDNKLYCTGFTQKVDGNKAIYVTRSNYVVSGAGSVSGTGYQSDTTFNLDGKLVFDTTEFDEEGVAVKLQTDNKIVVLGYTGTKGILVRFTSDGFLDRTFNQKGFYTFEVAQITKPKSLAIQTDGKILVSGNSFNGNNIDVFLTRINANGVVDTSFGTNGVIVKDINNQDNTGNAMVIANDGSIYIGGKSYIQNNDWANNPYSFDFSILKYTSEGVLDTQASNGILPGAYVSDLSTDQTLNPNAVMPSDEEITTIAYDNLNNRIYVYGYLNRKTYGAQSEIISKKFGFFSKCLTLDNNFSSQSSSTFQIPNNYTEYESEIVYATIKPADMVMGSNLTPVHTVVRFSNCDAGVSTYLHTPNSFVPTSCFDDLVTHSIIKIVKSNDHYFALVFANESQNVYKLSANFEIDMNFGINGKISNVQNFFVDSEGKIICYLIQGNQRVIIRYSPDGQEDRTFGIFGRLKLNPRAFVASPENEYFAIHYENQENTKLTLRKIFNNGEVDPSFPTVTLLEGPNIYASSADEIFLDEVGNIYTLTYEFIPYTTTSLPQINLNKVNANGSYDNTFGVNGKINLAPFFNEAEHPIKFVRKDNGKLLVCTDERLIQFNPDGNLDLSFGENGILSSHSLLSGFQIEDILVKGNDCFLGGITTTPQSKIIKINDSGSKDLNFGINGVYAETSTDSEFIVYELRGMFFDTQDKIIFFGTDNFNNPIKRLQ